MDKQIWQQAAKRLSGWQRTMLVSHERPDGDSLGSMGALRRVIELQGRRADAFLFDEYPQRYQIIKPDGFIRWSSDEDTGPKGVYDGIVILDTCAWNQIKPAVDFLKASPLPRIIVDHHTTSDALAKPDRDLHIADASSASTCGMIYEWFEATGWPLDEQIAQALFVGLATDTGWFRFSNTDERTLRAAAALLETGARADSIYAQIYETSAPARLLLKAAMLNTLRFEAEGRLAVMRLTQDMFEQAGAKQADAEDLVNEPMSVAGMVVSVLLTDYGQGKIRVNLRSRSPEVAGCDIDVAAIARSFGGGGHRRAAGVHFEAPLELAESQIVSAILSALK
ncbi:MAG: hypothetical protein GXY44_12395 [Phycisphaerales bacterium]|nr:hypothetical protein [Phycisphaerales bacterium]